MYLKLLSNARKSASTTVYSRAQLALHATHPTSRGATPLGKVVATWWVITRRLLLQNFSNSRIYGHTTITAHDLSTPPPTRASLFFHVKPSFISPGLQWCGSSSDPEPLSHRLLAFAQADWKNKAIYQLNFSSYCPPGAFCEQSIDRLPPVSLDAEGGWDSLQYAQVRICIQASCIGSRLRHQRFSRHS